MVFLYYIIYYLLCLRRRGDDHRFLWVAYLGVPVITDFSENDLASILEGERFDLNTLTLPVAFSDGRNWHFFPSLGFAYFKSSFI